MSILRAVLPTALATMTGACLAAGSGGDSRFRGLYTFGHEVRSFCPDVSAQCYWVSPDSPPDVQAALRDLARARAGAPYEPVCVLVEGRIDRDSPREGFAADYDGLIIVHRLLGACSDIDMVIESDLRHHRWVLESVDGVPFARDPAAGPTPELDFGEQRFVSGNTGCNRFSGMAVLDDDSLRVEFTTATTDEPCTPSRRLLESTLQSVLLGGATVSLDERRRLILESPSARLVYRLRDWVS
jgi:heat shock protein HslJ